MKFINDTLETFHAPISWLKSKAVLNIFPMSLTLDVVHPLMLGLPPLLKFCAKRNMLLILVTPETFQEPIFWSKFVALQNIPVNDVMFDKSQEFKLLIVVNVVHPLNIELKVVVPLKFNVSVTPVNTKLEQP